MRACDAWVSRVNEPDRSSDTRPLVVANPIVPATKATSTTTDAATSPTLSHRLKVLATHTTASSKPASTASPRMAKATARPLTSMALLARAVFASTRFAKIGNATVRRSVLAIRMYWAPTGRPCRLFARACSTVPA